MVEIAADPAAFWCDCCVRASIAAGSAAAAAAAASTAAAGYCFPGVFCSLRLVWLLHVRTPRRRIWCFLDPFFLALMCCSFVVSVLMPTCRTAVWQGSTTETGAVFCVLRVLGVSGVPRGRTTAMTDSVSRVRAEGVERGGAKASSTYFVHVWVRECLYCHVAIRELTCNLSSLYFNVDHS